VSAVYLKGVGVLGPGFADWTSTRAILAGEQPYVYAPAPLPNPEALPPTERRRGAKTVRWAVGVASQAMSTVDCDPAGVATVFTSSSGDGETLHQICESLAGPGREVSPTRFHNSVHNAAAGYWSIAAHSERPSVTLCGYDASFAAGLIEAVSYAAVDRAPVLLVAYDLPYPAPLDALRGIAEAFAVALLLAPVRGENALARWSVDIASGAAARAALEGIPESLLANPAAHALPLLAAVARRERADVDIEYVGGNHLQIRSEPC
jgi:hypothetical protein